MADLIPTVATVPNAAPSPSVSSPSTSPSPSLIPTSPASGPTSLASSLISPPSAPPASATPGLTDATTVKATSDPTIAGVGLDETVSGQLNKLLSQSSPYLDLARSQAQQQAASRGLQNSSLAAGSGEAAAIGAAAPIAQADATINTNRATQDLNAINTFGQVQAQSAADAQKIQEQEAANSQLQAEAAQQNIQQIIEQGDINAKLQASDQAFKAVQADLDRGAQINLANVNFQNQQQLIISQMNANSTLSAQDNAQQLQRLNQTHQDTLDQIAAQAKANLSQYGPQLQSQYLTAVSNRMASASQEVTAIYQTQGLTSTQQQQAVTSANQRMATDIASIQSYFAASPLWDPSWGKNTPAPAPAPKTPGKPGSPITIPLPGGGTIVVPGGSFGGTTGGNR